MSNREDNQDGFAVIGLDKNTDEIFLCAEHFDTYEEAEKRYGRLKNTYKHIRYLPIPKTKGWKYKPVWVNK